MFLIRCPARVLRCFKRARYIYVFSSGSLGTTPARMSLTWTSLRPAPRVNPGSDRLQLLFCKPGERQVSGRKKAEVASLFPLIFINAYKICLQFHLTGTESCSNWAITPGEAMRNTSLLPAFPISLPAPGPESIRQTRCYAEVSIAAEEDIHDQQNEKERNVMLCERAIGANRARWQV